jgi:hypothetical protein
LGTLFAGLPKGKEFRKVMEDGRKKGLPISQVLQDAMKVIDPAVLDSR